LKQTKNTLSDLFLHDLVSIPPFIPKIAVEARLFPGSIQADLQQCTAGFNLQLSCSELDLSFGTK